MSNKFGVQKELDEKTLIFQQIERCNILFSSFSFAPQTIDANRLEFNAMEMSQQGKKIAFGVVCLEKLVQRRLAEKGFFKSEKVLEVKNKAFGTQLVALTNPVEKAKSNSSSKKIYLFLSEDTQQQFEGIMNIFEYYGFLLDSIFGLPEFADSVKTSLGSDTNPEDEAVIVEESD